MSEEKIAKTNSMTSTESKRRTSNAEQSIDTTGRRRSSNKRRSSILRMARMSFVRSGGDRGASVDVLRGKTGSDFEGAAKIIRGENFLVGTLCCGLFGGGGGGEGSKSAKKTRFLLVKGASCFVFSDESSPSPKYAIDLAYKMVEVEEGGGPGGRNHTALLQTNLGDVEYKIVFETREKADEFAAVVGKQARVAEQDISRVRLGHGHLLNRHESIKYAEKVAQKKLKDQPDEPLTADEVMAAMPSVPGGI